METTRRGFLQVSGLAVFAGLTYSLSTQTKAFASEVDPDWKLIRTEESTSVCCYCSGGCGLVISVRDGELINIEGDSDHPINEGGLCSKGASLFQLRNVIDPETREVIPNPNRVTRPLVRRAGASDWEELSWDDAIEEIARRVKDTRDATFVEKDKGVIANRCDGIASLGGAQLHSEDQYGVVKTMRGLGLVAIDNQARV